MKIYKITEASEYLGVSINTIKTLANNGKIKSFKTTGKHKIVDANEKLVKEMKDGSK
jgi:excisionase family DNA binding protein